MLCYSPDQLRCEFALLCFTQFTTTAAVIGEEQARIAFGIDESSTPHFTEVPHPDYLPIQDYPLLSAFERLDEYVRVGNAHPTIGADVVDACTLVQQACSSENIAEWKHEREEFPESTGSNHNGVRRFEFAGNYYRGICESITHRATARWKIDSGSAVTFDEMASLVDRSERTIMNAAQTGQLKTLPEKDARGRTLVAAENALAWLVERGYEPSRTQVGTTTISDAQAPETTDDFLFVPVAGDGSMFLPGTRNGRGYTIGPKGSEEKYDEYFAALDRLGRMNVASWRRPNSAGNYGIVRAVNWTRIPRSQIERDLGTTHN
jgi:hypothetical protein